VSLGQLQETKRGTGIVCRCGKPVRITARGQTLCYNCFDAEGVLIERFGIQPDLRDTSATARTPRHVTRSATNVLVCAPFPASQERPPVMLLSSGGCVSRSFKHSGLDPFRAAHFRFHYFIAEFGVGFSTTDFMSRRSGFPFERNACHSRSSLSLARTEVRSFRSRYTHM